MAFTRIRARLIGDGGGVLRAITPAVDDARDEVLIARWVAAGSAGRDLIAREDGVGLLSTPCPIMLAHQPAGAIRSPQMARAVDLPVHCAS